MIPYLSTLFFEAISTDAAPSFNELAFAAVIEPFFLNTGLILLIFCSSNLRGSSSVSTKIVPFFVLISMGTISFLKYPFLIALFDLL
jgi:hypothetical protein